MSCVTYATALHTTANAFMDDAAFSTSRLHLRLLDAGEPSHGALYRMLYTCPIVMDEIGPPLTPEAAQRGFEASCRHNARALPGHRIWAVCLRERDELIGLASLQRDGRRAEFGAVFAPPFWGSGYAGEVLRPLLRYGFVSMGCDAVDARSRCRASLPVIERLLKRMQFASAPASEAGTRNWTLDRGRWLQTTPDQ